MSLLYPREIRIGMGATYAVLACLKGKQVIHWEMQKFDATSDYSSTQPWQEALSILSLWLEEQAPRGGVVKVMLSAELALLHLLPWREDLQNVKHQELLAKSHFRRIYDKFSDTWKTSVTNTGYAAPWLASAIDGDLLESIVQLVSSNGAKLKSVTPLSISLFNHMCKDLDQAASWVLVAEPATLSALLVKQGQWQLIQRFPANSLQSEPLAQILLRETRLAGMPEEPAAIYLATNVSNELNFEHVGYIKLDVPWHATPKVPFNSPLHLLGAL